MQELVTGIASLAGLIEKGGIVGVLLIVVVVLVWERQRLVKQLALTYRQRDKARLIGVRYRSALDQVGKAVDTSDIEGMFAEEVA